MNNRPYFEELLDAAKGVFALIRGEQDKLNYFNFSRTGLVGSFIAVLIGVFLQEIFSAPPPKDIYVPAWANLVSFALVYSAPIVVTFGFLSIVNQQERLLPYVVVNNWAIFFFTLISVAIFIFNLHQAVGIFILFILAFIIFWHTSRIILGFTGPQTILFLVATAMALAILLFISWNIKYLAAGIDPSTFLDIQPQVPSSGAESRIIHTDQI